MHRDAKDPHAPIAREIGGDAAQLATVPQLWADSPTGEGYSLPGSGPGEFPGIRARLAGIDFPDPLVAIDAETTILDVVSWPWSQQPLSGESLCDAFEPDSAAEVERVSSEGWVGVGERRFSLLDGPMVTLSVAPLAEGFLIALHDVTARQLLDQAAEQRKRMLALSELAGSLGRELTDPMSIVQGRLELLLDLGVSDPEVVRRHLVVALEHALRVTATLRNLRLVGRTAEPNPQPVRLDEAVREALDLVGPRKGQVLVRLEPADLSVGGDAALTARVLASLVRQCLESVGRSPVHLRARRLRAHIVLRIGPTGRTGRTAGQVIADGEELALDRTLLASVGGELLARRAGGAFQFEVSLPAPPTHRMRRRPTQGRIAVAGSIALMGRVTSLLDRDGYELVHVTTADGVLDVLEQGPVYAVIADLLLDGDKSGLTLAQMILRRDEPAPKLLVVSLAQSQVLPTPLVPLKWPIGRVELLDALGIRTRR